MRGAGALARDSGLSHRLSKSTESRTSCTLKYFASDGYFLATASYIAYATFLYEICPAGPVRSSEIYTTSAKSILNRVRFRKVGGMATTEFVSARGPERAPSCFTP